jgi:hypothetical protein
MLKTISKLILLTIFGSLFALSYAQTTKAPPPAPCTFSGGQCVSHGCASGCLLISAGHCACVD